MLSIILFLIILYIVAGIIGFVVHGLFWLFIVAAVLFVFTVLSGFYSAGRRRGHGGRPPVDPPVV